MASQPTTPPTAAELSQLRQAFSKDPTSEAYYPLAAAYLASERFMEAMVVCKKGMKAFPAKAEPHILMSRIYAAQKKDAKALDEAKQAVELAENNTEAIMLYASRLLQNGQSEDAKSYLKKALLLAPEDEEILQTCRENGIEIPKKEAPPPQPVQAPEAAAPLAVSPAFTSAAPAPAEALAPALNSAPPQAEQTASQQLAVAPSFPMATAPASASPVPSSPAAQIQQPQLSQPPFPVSQTPQFTQAAQYNPQNYVQQRGADAQERERVQRNYEAMIAKYGDPDDEPDGEELRSKSLTKVLILGIIMFLVVGGLGGLFYYKKTKAARETEIAQLLKKMQEEISHDNYASYKKACELGEKITTELDPDLFSAHSFLAYAYAIRWGEHGEGDRAREAAEDHLNKAKKAGIEHSYLNAADAYITYFKGDPDQAIRQLEATISEPDSKGKNSTLLISTLGILQTNAGNLESALLNLKRAQQAAPADPRISAWTGNALRRQGGNEILAANAYEQALRYEKNHAEAQLGVALMAVDADKPSAAERYINLLLKAEPPPSNRQLALARLAHAIILDGKSNKAEADEEEQRALASDPDNGELYMMKAERQKRAGDMRAAIDSIKTAISKDPKRISFQISLAEILLNQSQKERGKEKKETATREARDNLKSLAAKSPNSIKLLILLGKSYMFLGEYGDAESTFSKAMSLATKSVEKSEIFLEQGNLAVYQGKSEDAHKAYAEAQKTAGTSRGKVLAMIQEGHLYAKDGDARKALEIYAEAQVTDETYMDTYFFIGHLLAFNKDIKDVDAAKEQLNEYIKKAPNGAYAEQAKRIVDRLK